MAENSMIEWTDDTVNPWWGCTKVSPACTHCYAEAFSKRTGRAVWGPKAERWVRIDNAKRDLLKSVRRAIKEDSPRRVFMCSMADIFDEHPDLIEPRAEWWAILHEVAEMRLPDGRPAVIPLILSKRPEAMAAYAAEHGWPSNAWAGTTVEDQRRADERIPHLLRVPAPVRFLSLEPLLGPVDLGQWIERIDHCNECGMESAPHVDDVCPHCHEEGHTISTWGEAQAERYRTGERYDDESALGRADLDGVIDIHWLIIGGESGPKARPMHPEWARSLIAQGQEAGVPVLFKQWGAWAPDSAGDHCITMSGRTMPNLEPSGRNGDGTARIKRIGKKAAGRIIDGRTWDEVPRG